MFTVGHIWVVGLPREPAMGALTVVVVFGGPGELPARRLDEPRWEQSGASSTHAHAGGHAETLGYRRRLSVCTHVNTVRGGPDRLPSA